MFQTQKLRRHDKRKRKRSGSVLWQKPLHQQKCQKGKVTTQTTPQKSSIKQRLRTDLGRSVGVTTATQLVWLTGLRAHLPTNRNSRLIKRTQLKFMKEWSQHLNKCKSQMEQDQVSGGVSVLCWLTAPVPMFYENLQNLVLRSRSVIKSSSVISLQICVMSVIVHGHVPECQETFGRGRLHNVWWDPHIDHKTSWGTISNVPVRGA